MKKKRLKDVIPNKDTFRLPPDQRRLCTDGQTKLIGVVRYVYVREPFADGKWLPWETEVEIVEEEGK